MTDRMHSKVTLTTGSGSGIGASVARRLSNEDADVILLGRRAASECGGSRWWSGLSRRCPGLEDARRRSLKIRRAAAVSERQEYLSRAVQ